MKSHVKSTVNLMIATALAGLIFSNAGAQTAEGTPQAPVGEQALDTDRGIVLVDTDEDGYPDLTESLEGTNPLDRSSYPGADFAEGGEPAESDGVSEASADESADVGFPAASCRSGYRQAGSRLCISTNVHDARSFANASTYCRDRLGRVANYGDLRYLYVRTNLDSAYNPSGRWLGDWTGDDQVLCGNKSITSDNDPDISNFDGTCNRFDKRNFWCAHDLQ